MNATSKKYLFLATVIALIFCVWFIFKSGETTALKTETATTDSMIDDAAPIFENEDRNIASVKESEYPEDQAYDDTEDIGDKDNGFETAPGLIETVAETTTEKVVSLPISEVTKIQFYPAPFSNTKELFSFDEGSRKYPVRLKWSGVKGADRYEIEINREDKTSKKYFQSLKNKFDIMIFPNRKYNWRVVAYKNDSVITEYSPLYPLRVELSQTENYLSETKTEEIETGAGEEESEVAEYTDLKNLDESENNTFTGFEKLPELDESIQSSSEATERTPASSGSKLSIWGGFWAWLGVGGNAIDYQQKINQTAGLDYNTIQSPSYSGAFGFFISDKIAVELTGGASAGRFNERGGLFDEDYVWTTYGLEALYLLGSGKKSSKDSSWYLRFGGKYHDLPILEAYPLTRDVNLLSNNILGLSLGIGKRTLHSKRFRSEFYVSYQQPLSAVTEESDYKLLGSTFVNSYLGLNYQVYGNYHLGLFWQGQYYDGEYSLSNGLESVEGRQTLINNKLGVFLGLDF